MNRRTASAAEMIVAFARDKLADDCRREYGWTASRRLTIDCANGERYSNIYPTITLCSTSDGRIPCKACVDHDVLDFEALVACPLVNVITLALPSEVLCRPMG